MRYLNERKKTHSGKGLKLSGSGLWSQGSMEKDTQEKNTEIQAQLLCKPG